MRLCCTKTLFLIDMYLAIKHKIKTLVAFMFDMSWELSVFYFHFKM